MLVSVSVQASVLEKGGVELLVSGLVLHPRDLHVQQALSRALLTMSRGGAQNLEVTQIEYMRYLQDQSSLCCYKCIQTLTFPLETITVTYPGSL
jgi:hypothetical protein